MGTLTYSATVSLDGYVADATGDFHWSAPDEEVFRFHVERMEHVTTEVLGRNTYLLMRYWEAEPDGESWIGLEHEFARRWQAIDHVVASSTLTEADLGPGRVRLVRALGAIELEQIVRDAAGEVEIFGPTVAGEAIRAGLVTDFRFSVVPTLVGGGLRALPDGVTLGLRLVDQRTFGNGVVHLHYTAR